MNIFQLKAFCTVVQQKNMSLAAEDLFVSQSCLSKTIRALEDELDIILFTRRRGSMTLTSAGECLYDTALGLLKEYDILLDKLAKYQIHKKNHLSMALTTSQSYYQLLEPIKSFQFQYPEISISISENEKDTIFKLLESHSVDLLITWVDQYSPITLENYDIHCFKREQRCLLVPEDHPFAKKISVSLSEAQTSSFVFPSNPLQQAIYSKICQQSGFTPHVSTCYSSINTQLELVAQGFGVSIIPESMAGYYSGHKVKAVSLNPPIYNLLAIITQKNEPNKMVHRFIDYYLNFMKKRYDEDE